MIETEQCVDKHWVRKQCSSFYFWCFQHGGQHLMKGLTWTAKRHWCWSTAESPKLREALISVDPRSCLLASPVGATPCFSRGVCIFMAVRQCWCEMQGMLGLVDKEEFVSFSLSASLVALCGERHRCTTKSVAPRKSCVLMKPYACLQRLPVDESQFAKILEAGLNLGSMATVFFLFFFLTFVIPCQVVGQLWCNPWFFFCCDTEFWCLFVVVFLPAQF